jgi:deazaflavin-dependent oxidoreductase (nitroreductase family)
MALQNEGFRQQLSLADEVTITVIGRKSGRSISIPVWFVLDGDQLYLLPVQGSETQWYKNVSSNSSLGVGVGKTSSDVQPRLIHDGTQVSLVADKFRQKYGAADVKKYYSKFDVALVVDLP